MLTLMILGFLAEETMHGYELRKRIMGLSGYSRNLSDGSLYPAIKRLRSEGLLTRHRVEGKTGVTRQELRITDAGRRFLHERLRDADGTDITDITRFMTILAFLSQLPDPQERKAVLRRRLEFLEAPRSFFFDGERPLRESELDDVYRRGMISIACAQNLSERAWLRQMLGLPEV
ncbi:MULTISPECIES: PadR family transcriptional regulator [unclassified Actinobaculum]|uniref:PadR family transcriptional regulator n=1 Tax=unclassified Actinobaculum TaxID=2609299 RepID=UPI000D529E95|nr:MULTISPECIES: PadR family transcriptional regulator [unclassified Actinobaculum]AWE42681.1 PadR family transcriptional regulator [Actinobaculum sp. 313]RTE49489.1 PadR family transcriptional regulator [Actinobaculum sp. 352]